MVASILKIAIGDYSTATLQATFDNVRRINHCMHSKTENLWLHANAPDVVDMFQQLRNYDRFEDDEFAQITQLRSTTALCTLLKGRSFKMLGVQLLMLIGRATSKQVRTST